MSANTSGTHLESRPPLRCIILGAAGRDFHNFQTFFRQRPEFHVCAFTFHQIPLADRHAFPRELAGAGYAADIPIFPEEMLPDLIRQYDADLVCLSYSDLSHEEVMHKASLAQANGASFMVLGPRHSQLRSHLPVIAVTAVRTGCGKSPLTRWLMRRLSQRGKHPAVVRHPMPYGDLQRQAVQRIATQADLDDFQCTIEEREEYQPYLDGGFPVFAGVDYERILQRAEAESDVILWDGGNNDFSFFVPGLHIVVADALRPGHELHYFPGETNFRSADILVINKVTQARSQDIAQIRSHAQRLNPGARIVEADLCIQVDRPQDVSGRRALVVEDGPTLTHGGMSHGAGWLAAQAYDAGSVIDPRPFAVGSIAEAFRDYPHLKDVLPALGYDARQRAELQATIEAAHAEVIIDASPAGLHHMMSPTAPIVRVTYEFDQVSGPPLDLLVDEYLAK